MLAAHRLCVAAVNNSSTEADDEEGSNPLLSYYSANVFLDMIKRELKPLSVQYNRQCDDP